MANLKLEYMKFTERLDIISTLIKEKYRPHFMNPSEIIFASKIEIGNRNKV